MTGERVLATQLKGVADTLARADGVVATPTVVALNRVLRCQGAVAFDGVLGTEGALVVQWQVSIAITENNQLFSFKIQ